MKHAHELRQAAFKLYASLGSNDEDIRKKVRYHGGFSSWIYYQNVLYYIILYSSPLIYINFPLQITETENMMDRIVSGLSESSIKVRLAAVRYDTPFLLIVVYQKTKATIHYHS